MAGKNLVSDTTAMAVHWVGLTTWTVNDEIPERDRANGWSRVMRATPGYLAGACMPGEYGWFPVSLESFEFILNKAAATVIPVVVMPTGQAEAQRGPITSVYRNRDTLCVRGPTLNLHLNIHEIAEIRVRHRSATGTRSMLEIYDHPGQRLARFCTEQDYCLAWHALMGWLLLREAQLHEI